MPERESLITQPGTAPIRIRIFTDQVRQGMGIEPVWRRRERTSDSQQPGRFAAPIVRKNERDGGEILQKSRRRASSRFPSQPGRWLLAFRLSNGAASADVSRLKEPV